MKSIIVEEKFNSVSFLNGIVVAFNAIYFREFYNQS